MSSATTTTAAGDPGATGATPIAFAKGHGTENDFVLVDDPDGLLDLGPDLVARLCDRRAGIGGDGLIRVVRTAAAPQVGGQAGQAEWFMDYRNADGSPAEMCGNGIRVFVAELLRRGRVHLPSGADLPVATRDGVKRVRRDGDLLAVGLGAWQVGPPDVPDGVRVTLPGAAPLPGLPVSTGNPHVVVVLPDTAVLAAVDLSCPPLVEPVPAHGANVELVVPLHESGAAEGHLVMRVHERGVGETRSCGTGAAAAVLAVRAWAGAGAPRRWLVDVPGGRLRVTVPDGSTLSGTEVELAGPAQIVADGVLVDGGPVGTTGGPRRGIVQAGAVTASTR